MGFPVKLMVNCYSQVLCFVGSGKFSVVYVVVFFNFMFLFSNGKYLAFFGDEIPLAIFFPTFVGYQDLSVKSPHHDCFLFLCIIGYHQQKV